MTSERLTEQKCQACEGGTPPLTSAEVERLLAEIDDAWSHDADAAALRREFRFRNFHHTIGFVNAVAWIANREDHHPDLEVGYNRCVVTFTTHAIGGISRNDFICAAKVDNLLA